MYLERQPATASPEHHEEPERLRAPAAPPALASLSPQAVIALQRSAGNAAVGRMLARAPAMSAAPPAAGSGVDWVGLADMLLFTKDGVPTTTTFRQIGELGRIVPLLGAATGAAADGLLLYEDVFGPTWQYEAPIVHALIGFRGVVNIVNNGLGHLNYVSQLTQDTLATFTSLTSTPFTLTLNEVLAVTKVMVDVLQATTDSTITAMALWKAFELGPPAPGRQAEFDAWLGLAYNYEANLIGDVISMFFDGLDTMTAGVGHGNSLEDLADFIRDIDPWIRKFIDLVVTELLGQLNLRGGAVVERGAEDVLSDPLARDAAIWTLRQMMIAHQRCDAVVGEVAGAVGELAARAREIGTALLDGRDPFAFVREQAAGVVGELHTRIAALGELGQGGAASAASCEAVLGYVEQTRAGVDALELPADLGLEAPDLGEGMLADAGEALLGAGAGLAGQGAAAMLAQALDTAKESLNGALDTVAEHAEEIGGFMRVLAEQAARQTVELEGMLGRLEEALGRTENFEELFETLIEQALAAAGIDVDVDFDAVRAAWDDAGRWIDEMLADFESRRDGGPPLPVDEAGIRGAPRLAGGGQSEEP